MSRFRLAAAAARRLLHAAATPHSTPAHPARDTIAAVSTAPGAAALAVVRVSGPAAPAILLALSRRSRLPVPRSATLVRVWRPDGPVNDDAPTTTPRPPPLDTALVLYFDASASYTGEPAVELHVHGGPVVVAAVLDATLRAGARHPTSTTRLATPGEFTRRAFDAGKLDLTAAEGVAALTTARSEAARAAAAALADGALTRAVARWRDRLLHGLAMAEAAIEFEDDPGALSLEEGGSEKPAAELPALATALAADLRTHLTASATAELAAAGVRVALAGAPNAGKSSLANALANRAASIVSPAPGTTRDVVETHVTLTGGTHVVVCDAAGVRDGVADAAEAEGVARARRLAAAAPVVCAVVDGEAAVAVGPAAVVEAVRALVPRLTAGDTTPTMPPPSTAVVAVTKADAAPADAVAALAADVSALLPATTAVIPVSSTTGEGVPDVARALAAAATAAAPSADPHAPPPLLSRARHREAVAVVARRAEAAAAAAAVDAPERAAEDLRAAIAALDALLGRGGADVEETLGRVFAEFCVGK